MRTRYAPYALPWLLPLCTSLALLQGCGNLIGIGDVSQWDGGAADATANEAGPQQDGSATPDTSQAMDSGSSDSTMPADGGACDACDAGETGTEAGGDAEADAGPDAEVDASGDVEVDACDAGQTCNPGGNLCQQGTTDCSGACVNVTNVGDGTPCGAGQVCCGGACDTCSAPSNGSLACSGTSCTFTCSSGYTPCGSSCCPASDGGVVEAYVVNAGSADAGASVSVLSVPANQVVTTIPIGPANTTAWTQIAISRVAPLYAYVTDPSAGTVTAIDTASNSVVQTVTLASGSTPWSVAVSPDGKNVAVSERGANQAVYIDTSTWTVTPIPSTTFYLHPSGVQYKPDGTELWVGCGGGNGPPCSGGGDGVRRFS